MKSKDLQGCGVLRRLCLLCGLAAGLAIMVGGGPSLASMQNSSAKQQGKHGISQKDAYLTTVDYVVHFYPLWFTYYQYQRRLASLAPSSTRSWTSWLIKLSRNIRTLRVRNCSRKRASRRRGKGK